MKKDTNAMKDTVVLYHKHCTDGFSAAWAAWKKFGAKADYIGVAHQEPIPEGIVGKRVYLVDFCYNEAPMRKLISDNKEVTALDHHGMCEPLVKMTSGGVFDNDRSGAMIAWNYFHPKAKAPMLLRYVEDNDLWRFKLPNSQAITAWLRLAEFDFKKWSALARTLDDAAERKKCVAKGQLLLDNEMRIVRRLVGENAQTVVFEGHTVLAVNSPTFRDHIGDMLRKSMPPFGIIWDRRKGKTVVSLRGDGKTDVAEIAKRHGGGGHKASAGFTLKPDAPLPWKLVK